MKESFSFWKNLVLCVVFFAITPLTLGASLFSLLSLAKPKEAVSPPVALYDLSVNIPESGVKVFASLPTDFPSVSGIPEASDARIEIIRKYLLRYDSPMVSFAPNIVAAADTYKIDFRLTTAIAQQESNLCKVIPPGGHNCWGWGIHSEGTLGFSSYEAAIDTVTKGLATEYVDKGLDTPEKIMSKYTPLSDGSWARGVAQFLSEME